MSFRNPGVTLISAAALFWVSWLLMPGIGVTDAATIFELVSQQRASVIVSVITQLLSSALYVPALLGICCATFDKSHNRLRWAAGFLLLGAMGSAMDAVFHLLAYAMTMPGLDRPALLRVMAFMQGPGLRLVAPFIISFFVGSILLSVELMQVGTVSKASAYGYVLAFGIAIFGYTAASRGITSSRLVGLAFLGLISSAQVCIGIELSWPQERRAFVRKS